MKKRNQEKGAAMVIMAIVMLVFTTLSLSLMLCAFSFFQTAAKKTESLQVKELAVSMSRILEAELCGYANASSNDTEAVNESNCDLADYLKKNMFQDAWSCADVFEDSEPRCFSVDNLPEDSCDDLTVTMCYRYTKLLEDGSVDRNSAEIICVVTCEKNNEKAAVTSVYSLNVVPGSNSGKPDDEDWLFSLLLME